VLLAISTRSLPYIRRDYFVCNTNLQEKCRSVLHPPSLVFWRLLNRQPSRLAYFVCPESRNANADFNFFRAVTRSQPYSPEKGLLGLWWLSVTATPPPSHKKSFLHIGINSAFFASLGVFIVLPHTNALWLFAHFFRRKPTGFCLKNELCFLASFQKNRAQNES
jgi:hypothetical protein